MNVLLVYPDSPDNFWSFKYALKFISRKVNDPPLGLLTVAAMMPRHWGKKLIDMRVNTLRDRDIEWADLVFISGMSIQRESARKVIDRCRNKNVKTVGGGPLFTSDYEDFDDVDHLVLGEAEVVLPGFLEDLKNCRAEHLYRSEKNADMHETPIPAWELVNLRQYAVMDIQYSRGCPYDCEFCDIPVFLGHKVRTKTEDQVLDELEVLYSLGWRGSVFFVDDNFIGNKGKLKNRLLPAIIKWMDQHSHPFTFSTEASINLADDSLLMELMVKAGFSSVFVGIETMNTDSLIECNKVQNKNRDLIASVNKIHQSGMMVKGGFILGFDSDPPTVFERLKAFIQDSGICTAMVGLLNAPRGSRLYTRLKEEGRLTGESSGNNTDFTTNIKPKMDMNTLLKGYKKVIDGIYSCEPYYKRVKTFLLEYRYIPRKPARLTFSHIGAFFKSILFLGVIGKERKHFWNLMFWTMFKHPRLFPLAMMLAIYGAHFRRVFEKYLSA